MRISFSVEILYLAAGLIAGALAVLIVLGIRIRRLRVRHNHLHQQYTECRMELSAAREKSAMIEQARDRMAESFSALSAQALQENNQAFMNLAKATFSRYLDAAKTDMEGRSRAVGDMVQPLVNTLEKYEQKVREMEQARQQAYGSLTEQVSSMARTQQDLQRETGRLVQALRLPQVRGRWGEMTLRRVAEIAGMQDHCDFYQQPTAASEDGMLRPDMIVRLPGNRQVIIDAKVPLSAYLDSLDNGDEENTQQPLERQAGQVKSHMNRLAQKSYWRQFEPTPEFVVLFMPGENFFSAALSCQPGLIEEGAAKGVILATPTTLITLLKTVAYSWRQESAVENARAAIDLGSELYGRIYSMVRHFNQLGRDLDKSIAAYNKTVGTLERRVLVSARRFREMGVVEDDRKDLNPPGPVDNKARQMETDNAGENDTDD
ncbi:DNA recombination protein RmuC [Desulfosalsimonas propionicica]|uniref:DNA recombination protein RmuC n=1 Tax=Desulfosalsimonas propionicica TaxID=332175 RepID=A0A7W0C5T0_9BACT|nr:DNA recombination protein RmuC [Desulfosalsimonas propionicica]MBA2879734.1 DNA recombination protein RmuC [Desulfosalsimonas propionicica]